MSVAHRRPLAGRPPLRPGFTLIELLVVTLIIAALAALIIPAVFGAVRKARITEVVTDIKNLEAGIAAFKTQYGQEPPGRIVLCQLGSAWDTEPASKAVIRRIWPQFDFTLDRNIDGHGPADEPKLELDGAECLLFFLGGARDPTQDEEVWVPTGFSKNPYDPFAAGGNRVAPFVEFNLGRIQDTGGSHIPEYFDPLPGQTMPYLYASSYAGQGYNAADLGGRMADIYRQSTGGAAWNQKGFQIISPGYDGQYGPGGLFDPKSADTDLSGLRDAERDNITNFHPGELAR